MPVCSSLVVNENELHRSAYRFRNRQEMCETLGIEKNATSCIETAPLTSPLSNGLYASIRNHLSISQAIQNAASRNMEGILFPPARKVTVGACILTHPRGDKVANRVDVMLKQWVVFHQMQGFGRIYVYDHFEGSRPSNDTLVLDAVRKWMTDDAGRLVTYIRWDTGHGEGKKHGVWQFQLAQMNECIRRFRVEARFLAMVDIDEYVMPNPWFDEKFANAHRKRMRGMIGHYQDNQTWTPFSEESTVASVLKMIWATPELRESIDSIRMRRFDGLACPKKHDCLEIDGVPEGKGSQRVLDVHNRCGCNPTNQNDPLAYCDEFPRNDLHTRWEHSISSSINRTKYQTAAEQFWAQHSGGFNCDEKPNNLYVERHRCLVAWNLFGKMIVVADRVADMFVHRITSAEPRGAALLSPELIPRITLYGWRLDQYRWGVWKHKSWPDVLETLPSDPLIVLHTSDHEYLNKCHLDKTANGITTSAALRLRMLQRGIQLSFVNKQIDQLKAWWQAHAEPQDQIMLSDLVDDRGIYCTVRHSKRWCLTK